MSLVELLVTVGVSSVVILGAGSVMVFVGDAFIKIVDKDEAETSVTSAAYALRTIATQAVGLKVRHITTDEELVGGTGTAAGNLNDGGEIVTKFDNVLSGGTEPDIVADEISEIALFYREASATGNSRFLPTGIFFEAPEATCVMTDLEECSGRIYIITKNSGALTSLNAFSAGAPQTPTTDSQHSVLVFSKLSRLWVSSVGVDAGQVTGYARSARFMLTARYFLSGVPSAYNYIPVGKTGTSTANFKEITMEVYVGFRNNYLGRSQLVTDEAERLHGSLYYFPFVSTLRGI